MTEVNLDNLTRPDTVDLGAQQKSHVNLDNMPSGNVNLDALASRPNQFILGTERGFFESGQSIGASIQMIGKGLGVDSIAAWGNRLRNASTEELKTFPEPNQANIEEAWKRLQAGDSSAATDWLAYTIGNTAVSTVATVGAGAVGTALAGPGGGFAAMGGLSYLLNAGEVYNNLLEQGYDKPGAAALAGIPMALLDVVTPSRIFGKVVWQPVEKAATRGLGRALKEVGKEAIRSFATEGLTEGTQEAISAGTESLVTGKPFLTPETFSRVLNNFAAGGIAGAAFGAGGQAIIEAGPRSHVEGFGGPSTPVDTGPLTAEEMPREPMGARPATPLDTMTPEDWTRAKDIVENTPTKKLPPTPQPLEDLLADPNSPVFSTAKGAPALLPTHDIFVLPEAMDIKGRAETLNQLYFDGKLDIPNSDYDSAPLPKGYAGMYYWPGWSLGFDEAGNEYKIQRPTVKLTTKLAMTPTQADSILLHEMIHHELESEGVQTVYDRKPPGALHDHTPEFIARAEELSKQSGVPIAATHNIPVDLFRATVIKKVVNTAAKGTNQAVANQLVDDLITRSPRGLKLNGIPSNLAAQYRTRALLDALDSRGLSATQIQTLLAKRIDYYNKKGFILASDPFAALARINEHIANLRELGSAAQPIVQLYTTAPDAEAQQTAVEAVAPQGTETLITEPDTGYDYERASREGNQYKIEASNVQEAAERAGHITAESWVSNLTPKQRDSLEEQYRNETRNLPDAEVPSYGAWILQNAGIRPELEKLDKAMRYHYNGGNGLITVITKPYQQWITELGTQSRIALSTTEEGATPEPARSTSEQADEHQGLAKIFPELDKLEDEGGFDGNEKTDLNTALDKSGWFSRNVLTLLQFAQANIHIKKLQAYLEHVQQFWAAKSYFSAMAQARTNEWVKLGSEQQDNLGRFLYEQTLLSGEKKRRLYPDEQEALANKHHLSREAKQLSVSVDEDFRTVLAAMKQKQLEEVDARLNRDGDTASAAKLKAELETDYAELENRNYFPLMRFGKHVITVKTKERIGFGGRTRSPGDTIYSQFFERKRDRDKALADVQARFPKDKYAVSTDIIEDTAFAFQGFPPSVLNALESELEPGARQKIQEALVKMAPGAAFKKQMLSRTGIAGFSEDAVRAYSTYMLHASNHFARLSFYRQLAADINGVKDQVNAITRQGGAAEKRRLVHQYMEEHYRYLMNPGNEAAQLRGFIFKWYFWGNAKQLLVNMTQVPLVTWGYLGAKHGQLEASTALAGAYRDVFRGNSNPASFTEIEHNLITKAIQAGFIDESFATELAAASHGETLSRMRGQTMLGRKAHQIFDMGLFPFKWSENINRRVTYLAAIRLAMQKGMVDPEKLFKAGREAVQTTQAEYARWNRMPVARGGRILGGVGPLAFVFKSFTQHMIWFYATQPGRGRALVALLAAAGLMGLPGAEDVADIIDYLVTKLGTAFGMKDPYTDSRKWLRDTMLAAHLAPDLAMHGASRYTMGLYGLNMLAGIPIPAIDLSSSLSLGRVLPGIQSVFALNGTATDRVAKAVGDIGGVAGSMGVSLARAIWSDEPNTYRRWSSAMPPVMRNFIQAVQAGAEGAYTDRHGNKLVPLDPYDTEQAAELISYGILGGAPTRLRQAQEKNWSQMEARLYWLTRRELVLKDLAFSIIGKDPEGRADAMKALRVFNSQAPMGIKISSKDMKASLSSRIKDRRLRELGMPPEKRFYPLYRQIGSAYPTIQE